MVDYSTAHKHILFSHDYDKLPVNWEGTKATLVFVDDYRLESQNDCLIEFDTRFRDSNLVQMSSHPRIYKQCHYPLPRKGKNLFLLFKHESGMFFFTQRKWTIDKEQWYEGSIGEDFIMIRPEIS